MELKCEFNGQMLRRRKSKETAQSDGNREGARKEAER